MTGKRKTRGGAEFHYTETADVKKIVSSGRASAAPVARLRQSHEELRKLVRDMLQVIIPTCGRGDQCTPCQFRRRLRELGRAATR